MLTTADKKWVKETAKDIMHDEITQLIVGHIQPTLATKSDLEYFATKEDLNRLATKVDLKKFATKSDLLNFATKKELNEFRTEIKEDLNDIKNTLDTFMGEIKASREEQSSISYRIHRDHTPKLENHEKRITKLEANPL